MVALVAFVAVFYVIVLLPFKGLTIVPGIASVRPAGVLPVVFSLLFGPAAAWGAMFGNAVGDLLGGTWTVASYFGALGNFLFGLVGYRLWGNLGPLSSGGVPDMATGEQFSEYLVVVVVSSALTAATISWGVEVLGLLPFSVLGTSIALNNLVAGVVLGPPLLYVSYPLAERKGLLYTQVMDADALQNGNPRRNRLTAAGLSVVSVAWLLIGIGVSVVIRGVPFAARPGPNTMGGGGSTVQIALGSVAFVFAVVCVALGSQRIDELRGD